MIVGGFDPGIFTGFDPVIFGGFDPGIFTRFAPPVIGRFDPGGRSLNCLRVCDEPEEIMEQRHVNEIREIIYQARQGESIHSISHGLCLARNTVRKYLRLAESEGFLDSTRPLPDIQTLGRILGPPPAPRHMRSTVEPYAERVEALVRDGVEMQTIWQRLRDDYGYTGSYSSVRRYVQRVYPKEPEVVCRVETEPGEEVQVDFGSAGLQWDAKSGRQRKAWVFIMTLSWSRHQYVECVFDQTVRTWIQCHEHAFAWFGGVVRRVVIDNLKAGVLHAHMHDPVLGTPYRRLAEHYGFVISPNRPRTPQHKGKVESAVHYFKRNFLAGQMFADLQALNERARQWVIEVAGQRQHGTTREAPLARFHQTEKAVLTSLPDKTFDPLVAYRCKVHRDCHVVVEGSYYSVPYRWIGKTVDVYTGPRIVEIYAGTELIATHLAAGRKGERQTRMEHYPESKRAYLENPPERCRERATQVGPACAQVVDTCLKECVGAERLEKACGRALYYGDASYRRIKTILDAGLDQEHVEENHQQVIHLASYRFARPASTFFAREAPSC